jgi:ankyrin repeat protein
MKVRPFIFILIFLSVAVNLSFAQEPADQNAGGGSATTQKPTAAERKQAAAQEKAAAKERAAAQKRAAAEAKAAAKGKAAVPEPVAAPKADVPLKPSSPVDKLAKDILENNVEAAKTYFVTSLAPNDKDFDGRNALYFAAKARNSVLTDFFIRLGTDVDAADSLGDTPLNITAQNSDSDTARILVNAGANIHHKGSSGETPALIAIRDGNDAYLRAISSDIKPANGKDPSLLSTDDDGNTILHIAAMRGAIIPVNSILQSARTVQLALVTKKNKFGNTALDLCYKEKKSRANAEVSVSLINASATSVDPMNAYFAPAIRSLNYNQRSSAGVSPLYFSITDQYTGWTDYLLEKGANASLKNTDGDTPLNQAVRIADIDTVRKLITYRADVNAQDAHGNSPLHIGMPSEASPELHRDILALLLNNGANPNLRDEHGDSPVHILVSLNCTPAVLNMLLERNADVSIHNIKGETPLFLAVDQSRTELIPLLLSRGSDIFAANNSGVTPFERALQLGGTVLDELITEDTVKQSDNNGNTPILAAVRLNASADVVREILDVKDINVNARNQEGDTALHIAVRQNNAASGDLLISRGANVFLQNAKGDSPLYLTFFSPGGMRDWMLSGPVLTAKDSQDNTILHKAAEWKLDNVIAGIVQRGANVEAKNVLGETPLFVAVHINSASTVRSLVNAGASLNTRDPLGNTALHAAVRWDAQAAAEALIGAKIDINAYNLYGNTPLHDSVKLGRFALQQLLVQRGANPEVRDGEGNTALMVAVTMGNFRAADHLVRAGADANTRNNDGDTPLLLAVRSERSDLVKLLIDKGAQIHARNADGESPFTVALQTSPRMVLSLLEKGRDQTDDEGRSPLDIALLEKKNQSEIEDITKWVGDRQLASVDRLGWTSLRYACDLQNWTAAKFLTDQGSNVFAVARDGKTPVDIAFASKSSAGSINRDAVRALFGGKSISAQDTSGNTALHYAAKLGNVELIQFLLELGASRNTKNTAGESPYDIALRWSFSNAADILR